MFAKTLTMILPAILLAVVATATAQEEPPMTIRLLWPDGAPDAKGEESADRPELHIYRPAPERANGAAVMICPGGGYGHLAMGHEGKDVAEWYRDLGITAFVLKYRHAPGYRHPVPLQDATRGIRIIRSEAKDFGIDAARIGVMGFSAGGHLASTLATHYEAGDPTHPDLLLRASSRPDFLVLGYPVISFTADYTHKGSRRNLLGENPSPELVKSLSNELQVTSRTPPTFLFHTDEDRGVPPENSTAFYLALRAAKVPAELHIYRRGRHGVGLLPEDPILRTWSERLRDWLRASGYLEGRESQKKR